MPIKNPLGDKQSAFNRNNVSHDDVNPHLVDGLREREGTPIVGKPIPLTNIHPDARQPRRAIPAAVRAAAPGADAATHLNRWRELAAEAQGEPIDPVPHIMGNAERSDDLDLAPITQRLLDLYALAASIYKDGLMYPITVAKHAGGYLIETGERRYLAFTLLAQHTDADEYNKIPAQVMDEHSVWRQAQENNNRAELNAIEKARQLAILYMDMWADDRDFGSIDELITPAGSDRPYYAQAAELNARRGYGQRVLDAMGVSQRTSITYYKKLLNLSDDEWMEGDANNSPLNELLRFIDEREGTSYGTKPSYVNRTKHNDTPLTPSTHTPETRREPIPSDDDRERPTAPSQTRNAFAAGDRVYHDRHNLARIERVEDHVHVAIRTEDTNSLIRNVHESELHPAVEDDPQSLHTPLPRDERPTTPPATYHCPYNINDWLALESKPNRPGQVVHIKDEQNPVIVTVQMADNGEHVSALLGAWQRSAPAIPRPQRTQPDAANAAINDLPPDIAGELHSTIQVLALMAEQHEPTDDIENVRDALEVLRAGTLEDMTTDQLTNDVEMLKHFADYMNNIMHEALANAIAELKQRRQELE